MLDLLDTMRIYFRGRDLILSAEKTKKVMIFNKGPNAKKEKWMWQGKELEEVKNFKYLGFIFNYKGNFKDHIAERKKKGIIAAKTTWGLGERKCKNEFKRRRMLFNYLLKSVMMYGAEIWGWEEWQELEKVQLKYFKWILKLEMTTPNYLVYKELGLGKIHGEGIKRAIKYEKKISKLPDERLPKVVWNLQDKEGETTYIDERKKLYNKLGWSVMYVNQKLKENKMIDKEMIQRYRDIELQGIHSAIERSTYNTRYKDIMVETIPKYLMSYKRGIDISIMAKLRCGNFEKTNRQ